ncbi:EVE domain-containing protein [Parasulfitobacter algicola]|uniref:EVE domain-containing protein n=1 Tax=Parasulfitobacter algicola TaxID=2614809 RepID=A0ABX2IR35_9RHOB|nr:EVE domain-containing protein [Sulfitobacter algicola]NSX53257.1 EVE domain-containing protein [Sulfitobacter algicola]
MGTRYWIGVADKSYVTAAVTENICLFSGGQKAVIQNMNSGDGVIYYSPKQSHSGGALQCFTALGQVVGDTVYYKDDWPDHPKFKAWVRTCSYEKTGDTAVQSVLDRLEFIIDTTDWGVSFEQAQFEISENDFNMLAKAMRSECSD